MPGLLGWWMVWSLVAGEPLTVAEHLARQPAGQVTVVAPAADRAVTLGGLPEPVPPVVTPTAWSAPGQPVSLLLIRRDQAGWWPAATLATAGCEPDRALPGEVLLRSHPVGRGALALSLLAPDAAALRFALTDLLGSPWPPPAERRWACFEAVGVGYQTDLLRDWLTAKVPGGHWPRVLVGRPEAFPRARLDLADAVLVALTPAQWQRLPLVDRDALEPYLPPSVRVALRTADPLVAVTGNEEAGRQRHLAAAAPVDRLLAGLLPRGSGAASALALGDLLAAGGLQDLRDLRPVATVATAAVGYHADLDLLATALADQVRRGLAGRAGFRFLADAAYEVRLRQQRDGTSAPSYTGPAQAVLVARVGSFTSSSSTTPLPPRRLTPPGPGFTAAEPRRPDPEAREYVLVGPRVYPRGERDRKYREDLRRWQVAHRDWEEQRQAWLAEQAAAQVVWELAAEVRTTTLLQASVGLLDSAGRDLFCHVVDQRLETTQTVRSTVTLTGADREPVDPAPPAPAPVPPRPAEVVSAAAQRAVDALLTGCLVPADGLSAGPGS